MRTVTPEVHSSRIANLGRWYSRRPKPRRCCSPRLSWDPQSKLAARPPGRSARYSRATWASRSRSSASGMTSPSPSAHPSQTLSGQQALYAGHVMAALQQRSALQSTSTPCLARHACMGAGHPHTRMNQAWSTQLVITPWHQSALDLDQKMRSKMWQAGAGIPARARG